MRFFYLYACSRHAANDAAFAVSFMCWYYSIFEPLKYAEYTEFFELFCHKMVRPICDSLTNRSSSSEFEFEKGMVKRPLIFGGSRVSLNRQPETKPQSC